MLKFIKTLLERNAYAIAILLTNIIIYLSLMTTTSSRIMDVVSISDKSAHMFAYFILSCSWFFAVKSSHSNLYNKVKIGVLVLFFSIILELIQGSYTNHRTMDYFDMIANGFGIIIAIVSFKRLLRVYHTI